MLPLLLVIRSQARGEDSLRHVLGTAGLKAYFVETLAAALGIAEQWQFDAALVDAKGLDVEAIDLVKGLRSRVSDVPVVTILHSDDEDLLLRVLDAGASQVLAHAPSPLVIAAQLLRWIGVFRPRRQDDAGPVRLGPLRLDPRRARASIDGMDVKLTATEFELLLLLTTSAGDLVHRTVISRTLSSGPAADRSRTADMHVSRIRRKLKAAGGTTLELSTVYRQGYLLRLVPETNEPDIPRIEWSV